MFDELLRRTGYDTSGLANRLRALFEAPTPRVLTATIRASTSSVRLAHGATRKPQFIGVTPASPATLGVVWDTTHVTVTANVAPGSDLALTLQVL